ncbi:phytanoyl-CoA dioxygenase family protein [Runella sp.]|uniref:phytanoyl-CoA dioxygenase family protein n=1 Tax=Runella sp. TaxID=1960881 RepID=UPI003D0F5E46
MTKLLTDRQILQFISDGYIKLENAFPQEVAEEGRAILWKDTGCVPDDPTTWIHPVIRLGNYAQEPFQKAANTAILHAAFDQLVGKGQWLPCNSLGTFPVRFPSREDPGDAGWHVDASFPGDDPTDYFSWRININSKGRALLMLFLFSDVSDTDAPTRIRVGSHIDVARMLAPAGDAGMSFMELAQQLDQTNQRREVLATGKAGTVYLCHPFLAHAAQPHHGTTPRFMAQPPLLSAEPFQRYRHDGNYSPVEIAIRLGIGI